VYPPPKAAPVTPPQADASSETVKPPSVMNAPLHSNTVPTPEVLVNAEEHFRQGEYPEAIQGYETYLKDYPQDESRERILFKTGLSHALASGSGRSLSDARSALDRLFEEFPETRYQREAKLILNLIEQIRQLNRNVRTSNSTISRLEAELKKLKEIDLKRRPSRPPE